MSFNKDDFTQTASLSARSLSQNTGRSLALNPPHIAAQVEASLSVRLSEAPPELCASVRGETEQQLHLLSTVVAESLCGVIITDHEQHLVYANPAFLHISGYTLDELIGKRPGTLLQGELTQPEVRQKVREAIAAAEPLSVEIINYHKNGTPYWIEMHIAPVLNDRGRVTHFVAVENDITERKTLQTAEQTSRAIAEGQSQILEMIARGVPLKSVLNAVTRLIETHLPASICSLLLTEGNTLTFGAAPGLPEAYNLAVDGIPIAEGVGSCGTAAFRKERVIVEDIATDPLWANYASLAYTYGLAACWSNPIITKDGTVLGTFGVYHRTPRKPLTHEIEWLDRATQLVCIALEKHQQEEVLRERTEFVQKVMQSSPDCVKILALDTTLITMNDNGVEVMEIEDVLAFAGTKWLSLWSGEDALAARRAVDEALAGRIGRFQGFHPTAKGTPRWWEETVTPILDANGDVVQLLCISRDITEKALHEAQLKDRLVQIEQQNTELERQKGELASANEKLEALATTDGLTELKNHRTLHERLHEEYERARRHTKPLSLLMLDVDHFKGYNDAFGHPAGDAVLRMIASLLKANARVSDVVARYGGEEFCVILPETDAEVACDVAERFREKIEAEKWRERKVTVSIGVSTLKPATPDAHTLLAHADTALYRSKQGGRNRVTHEDDIQDELVLDTEAAQWYDDLIQNLLETQSKTLASGTERVKEMLIQAHDATISSWSYILDLKDKETEGHSQRVTEMMVQMARSLGMTEEEVLFARWGALLHDMGKIAVPDAILRKPGPLTEEEWVIMRQHTTVAFEMLSPIAFLRPAIDIPYCHHEKWDGSGYPRGLKGDEIPLVARLFAVIDVYDALTSDRPYRKAWDRAKVEAYLKAESGTHFDPRAVTAFFAMKGWDYPLDKAA